VVACRRPTADSHRRGAQIDNRLQFFPRCSTSTNDEEPAARPRDGRGSRRRRDGGGTDGQHRDTDTTYTTEIEDGGTQAYNATTATNFSWSADSANSKIVIEQDNETLYEATPDHEDEASGTYYYNATLADDGSGLRRPRS